MNPPDEKDLKDWHRYFAAAANNAAWKLAEQPVQGNDDLSMLDAAHASAWHWNAIGTEQQKMRATMLLAAAHARASRGGTALAYAEKCETTFWVCPAHRIGKSPSSTPSTPMRQPFPVSATRMKNHISAQWVQLTWSPTKKTGPSCNASSGTSPCHEGSNTAIFISMHGLSQPIKNAGLSTRRFAIHP